MKIALHFLWIISCALIAQDVMANVTPSPAMIEQFRQLPRAEQERLARQYGINLQDIQRLQTSTQRSKPDDESDFLEPVEREKTQQTKKDQAKTKRFGVSLFDSQSSTFSRGTLTPVPGDYVLGPDDTFHIQLFGQQSNDYRLAVNRDGFLNIPELGSLKVAGLTFDEARQLIASRIRQSLIGVESAISLDTTRQINVFIVGEAKWPGSYNLSALSSVTQALFIAGGVSDIGALRDIRVNRKGNTIARFDLYDLLLHGNASNDIKLQDGDVIFIAPVHALAEVQGKVRRPALFEVAEGDTFDDLLAMAGGAMEGSYPRVATIERFNANSLRELQNIDLTQAVNRRRPVQGGDILRIGETSPRIANNIVLAGAVVRPGFYAWYDGVQLNDIIRSLWSDLHASADLNYALVIREADQSGDLAVHQISLQEAIHQPESASNLLLKPRDKILVFHRGDELYQRSVLNTFLRERLEDKLSEFRELDWLKSEQLADDAFAMVQSSEDEWFTRPDIPLLPDEAQTRLREKEHQEQKAALSDDFRQVLSTLFDDAELLALTPHLSRTELLYPVVQRLHAQSNQGQPLKLAYIGGEVRVPGEYPIAANSSVRDLVRAAGGLKESAFLARAELTRALVDQGEYAIVHLEHKDINLSRHLSGEQITPLQSRDRLNIFSVPEWNVTRTITIEGEVRFPGQYTIQQGERLSQIIERAGGLTANAFSTGAIFTREQLRKVETEQLKNMVQQLREEVATRSISTDRVQLAPQDAFTMLRQLESQQPVGRLVIALDAIIAQPEALDLDVEDGDVLYIPRANNTVSIMGEVQHASSHRYKDDLTVDEYIRLAGGLKKRADAKRVYVVRADGSVMIPRTGWFRGRNERLQPGDTIIVPLDTEYTTDLSLWTQVTQIFYQSAVALAAISRI